VADGPEGPTVDRKSSGAEMFGPAGMLVAEVIPGSTTWTKPGPVLLTLYGPSARLVWTLWRRRAPDKALGRRWRANTVNGDRRVRPGFADGDERIARWLARERIAAV
jgi:hypothetical protein